MDNANGLDAGECAALVAAHLDVAIAAGRENGLGVWSDPGQVAGQIPATLAAYADPGAAVARIKGGDEGEARELVLQAMQDAAARLTVTRP